MESSFFDMENPFNFMFRDPIEGPMTAEERDAYDLYYELPEFATIDTYVEARHLWRYREALERAVKTGKVGVNRRTEKVPEPGRAEVADCFLKFMECTRMEGKTLRFYADAVMVAEIDIFQREDSCERLKSYNGKLPETVKDRVTQWYRVRGIIDPSGRRNEIGKVEIYDKAGRRRGRRLSKYLIPILSAAEMDDEAERILKKYKMADCVYNVMPVDVHRLAENMGLTEAPARLSLSGRVQSELVLHRCSPLVYDKDGREDYPDIKKDTILVDDDACKSQAEKNEAVAHEDAHKEEHSLFYLLQREYNENIEYMSCIDKRYSNFMPEDTYEQRLDNADEFYGDYDGDTGKRPLEWGEWQAVMIGPRILMPAHQTRRKIDELTGLYRWPGDSKAETYARIIPYLAAFYNVTERTAKKRMVSLGYTEAAGALNEVDGAVIPPFATTGGRLRRDISYVISRQDVERIYSHDPAFRAALDTGCFVYAEGHCCLNTGKYIEKWIDGFHLTDEARHHIEQCCLPFQTVYSRRECPYDRESLHNDDWKSNPLAVARADVGLDILRNNSSDVRKQINDLPLSFGETLKYYRKKEGMTQEEFAEFVGVERETITRYEKSKRPSITKQVVAQIGIACHLSGEFTQDLMDKAGCPLDFKDPRDFVLQIVIYHMFTQSVDDCSRFLIDHGCLPLGSRKKVAV